MPTPPEVTSPADTSASSAPSAKQGVIHDLGYRHYTGQRLGSSYITRALFMESAKGAFGLGRPARSKITPMLILGAMSLPALIIAMVASFTHATKLLTNYTAYSFSVQLLIMVFVAGQAPASVSRDLRFRVMSLYFSRPLKRVDYVVAKLSALATAVFVLMAIPLTILFAGALLAKLPISEQLPDYVRSLGGAALIALVLAAVALVIAALTPRRGLGVAAIIAVLAVLSGIQVAVQEIAMTGNQATFAGYSRLISPFSLVEGVQHTLLGAQSSVKVGPPGTMGTLVFAGTLVLLVAACFGALLLRYRKVSI